MDRYQRGIEVLNKMIGEEGIKTIKAIEEFYPDFADMIISFGFGDVYSRETLDFKQRELITLSSLITQGAFEQLGFHINAALNVGLTPKEIVELIMHCAAYAGFPKACGALNVTIRVFQERNIEIK